MVNAAVAKCTHVLLPLPRSELHLQARVDLQEEVTFSLVVNNELNGAGRPAKPSKGASSGSQPAGGAINRYIKEPLGWEEGARKRCGCLPSPGGHSPVLGQLAKAHGCGLQALTQLGGDKG